MAVTSGTATDADYLKDRIHSFVTGSIAHQQDPWSHYFTHGDAKCYRIPGYGGGDIKIGAPTISISSGVATLSIAQPELEYGDLIVYYVSSYQYCYVVQKYSDTSFEVRTQRSGGIPITGVSGANVSALEKWCGLDLSVFFRSMNNNCIKLQGATFAAPGYDEDSQFDSIVTPPYIPLDSNSFSFKMYVNGRRLIVSAWNSSYRSFAYIGTIKTPFSEDMWIVPLLVAGSWDQAGAWSSAASDSEFRAFVRPVPTSDPTPLYLQQYQAALRYGDYWYRSHPRKQGDLLSWSGKTCVFFSPYQWGPSVVTEDLEMPALRSGKFPVWPVEVLQAKASATYMDDANYVYDVLGWLDGVFFIPKCQGVTALAHGDTVVIDGEYYDVYQNALLTATHDMDFILVKVE